MERPGPSGEKPCCFGMHRPVTVRPEPCLRCARKGWPLILRSERTRRCDSRQCSRSESANRAHVTGQLGCRSSWPHDDGSQRVTWRVAVNHEDQAQGTARAARSRRRGAASRRSRATASANPVPPARGDASGQRRRVRFSATSPKGRPREVVVSEVVYEQVDIVRQQRPKGTVEVSREPASVAQDNPDFGIRIAVLPYGRRCLVVYLNPAN